MIKDKNNTEYVVIRNYSIHLGSLKDKKCDVAFQKVSSIPYVFPASIHTNPILLPMNMDDLKIKTQNSLLGTNWQYWSRALNNAPITPKNIVTHIATIFRDV